MFWFLAHNELKKTIPTLSFWWLFNRIQAKLLVIRYQLSVIGYQLLQQNCSTCFYLLLSVLLIIYIIILYFLTPVILIITPHYNYSATTYHDLMVIWQKNNLKGTLLLTNRFIMEYELCSFIAGRLKALLLQQHSGLIWKRICSRFLIIWPPCRPLCVCINWLLCAEKFLA